MMEVLPVRRRASATRLRILDAAEDSFSRHGYHGISLAEIAAAGSVRVALLHYHFGTKEELFTAVIERRAAENVAGLRLSLRTALLASGSRAQRCAAIIRAFVEPVFERSLRGGSGWKSYIRLMARLAGLPQDDEFLAPYRASFDGIVEEYVTALRSELPDRDWRDIHMSFYFLQAASTHILVESGLLDRQSQGALSSKDLDLIGEKLVDFCTAGFIALPPTPTRAPATDARSEVAPERPATDPGAIEAPSLRASIPGGPSRGSY